MQGGGNLEPPPGAQHRRSNRRQGRLCRQGARASLLTLNSDECLKCEKGNKKILAATPESNPWENKTSYDKTELIEWLIETSQNPLKQFEDY